ncbi:class I SAM-dependent methyltransferase [Brumimicrobium mesophilum]|uniref:class I SAM-dependent methyltransferase n=1 Tax=Brumimicrobium mesophilum TaxID=392717 RepID=UPI000D144357|nr:class I SAM-dependent methyltransferase [Brumimicrobium mesophilum]
MIKKIKDYYNWGGRFLTDPFHIKVADLNKKEADKTPLRSDIINFLLQKLNRDTTYLEIGVRNPAINYDKIISTTKYSVDPGLEFKENPVDFKLTSDEFFSQLRTNKVLSKDLKFDVIFIDGLHLADQVNRDIENALEFIKEDGFIILHDCNPPSEWHAREEHGYRISPAGNNWNGTTWKAFVKWRQNKDLFSCCVDTDWGVGIISKTHKIGSASSIKNPFFEYGVMNENRKESMNLISFEDLKSLL